jgi:hypothetical protein
MKSVLISICITALAVSMTASLTGCQRFKKKVPPNEMFAEAEQLRRDQAFVQAAARYADLYASYADSELAPAALYYTGICRYTMSIQCPGKRAFEQQKSDLAKSKREEYDQCISYMEKHKRAFLYDENFDLFLYNGEDFLAMISQYPSSNLVDDAAFQYVRNQIVGKQQLRTLTMAGILDVYADFFERYPQSPYRHTAIEDVVSLVTDFSGALPDPDSAAAAYQRFLPFRRDFSELNKVAYVVGKALLYGGHQAQAASVFGVPSIIGMGTVETARTRLNIRSGKGTQFGIIGKADKGDEMIVLEADQEWYAVVLPDGTTGYAHRDFVHVRQ